MHPTRLRCSVTSPEQSLPANWQSVQNQFTAVDREVEGMVERGDERVWLLDSVKALAEAVQMRHRGPHGVGGVARTEESESGRPVESSLERQSESASVACHTHTCRNKSHHRHNSHHQLGTALATAPVNEPARSRGMGAQRGGGFVPRLRLTLPLRVPSAPPLPCVRQDLLLCVRVKVSRASQSNVN